MDKFIQKPNNKTNIIAVNDNKSTSLTSNVRRSLIVHTEIPTLNIDEKLYQKTNYNIEKQGTKNDIEAILDKISATENQFDKGDEISDVDEIDETDMNIFKEDVKSWIDIDDKVTVLSREISLLKKKRLELNSKIVTFMRNYKIEDLNTNNGKLEYRVKHVKKGLSGKKIHENLLTYFKSDKDQAETIYKYLLANRIDIDKETLKRIKKI